MFNDLIDICRDKNVWIQTHNFPDPDAIASAFALQELLKHFGIEASLCHDGEIDKLSSTKMLKKLETNISSSYEVEKNMGKTDAIIMVDCQKNGGNTTDFIGEEIAAIDHHPTYVQVDYMYKDLRICGSCASIIADYFKTMHIEPSEKAATALVYGMRMDTLQFSRGVTEFDIEMYGYLFPYINKELLRELEMNNMEFEDLKAYGVAIDHVRVYGTVGFSYLDFECPDAMVAILSDFILSLNKVDVVILYAYRKDGFKFSIRSEREDVHAGILANEGLSAWGNGGGHAGMAGGFALKSNVSYSDEENFFSSVQDHFVDLLQEKYPQVFENMRNT